MSIITQNGYTALMEASWNGMTEIVDQLINAGATLDLQDHVCISCYVVVSHDVIYYDYNTDQWYKISSVCSVNIYLRSSDPFPLALFSYHTFVGGGGGGLSGG